MGKENFITYVNVFNNPLTDLYRLDSVEIDDKQRRVQYGDVLFTTSSETPEDCWFEFSLDGNGR